MRRTPCRSAWACSVRWCTQLPARRASPCMHPRALLATAETLRAELTAAAGHPEVLLLEVPDGEEAKDLAVAAYAWSVLGQGRLHPRRPRDRPRRRCGHRPRRLRRGDVAARRAGDPGAHHAARDGRRGRRRQDRDQHRGRQESRRRVPPAGGGALRSGDARDAARRRVHRRARRGGEDRPHRRPGDPRPARGRPHRPSPPARAHRAFDRRQGRGRQRRPEGIRAAARS